MNLFAVRVHNLSHNSNSKHFNLHFHQQRCSLAAKMKTCLVDTLWCEFAKTASLLLFVFITDTNSPGWIRMAAAQNKKTSSFE